MLTERKTAYNSSSCCTTLPKPSNLNFQSKK